METPYEAKRSAGRMSLITESPFDFATLRSGRAEDLLEHPLTMLRAGGSPEKLW